MGRQGRMIYQPLSTANVRNGKILRGGMIFIWDGMVQRGYVVSEALQGYAPLTAAGRVALVMAKDETGVAEEANGHACHRVERTAVLSGGFTVKMSEWRADDLRRFPVRIRTESEGETVTVDLTDVRFEIPPVELFAPPGGFTQYGSAGELINELMIRESALKHGPSGESGPAGQPENWRQQPGMGRGQ